jgi:sugar lactone lactonase YvrE
MPPFIAHIALALLVGSALRAEAQSDPVVASRAAYQEAVRSYEAHDIPAFLRHATEAARLRPAHGGVIYALASAHALAGDTAGALATLRRFAALGHTADLDADADFEALRRLPAYDSLRQTIGRNAAPLVRSRPAFTLAERDLLTEGIAYDPKSRTFFVGSVHRGKILRVDDRGRSTEFVPPGLAGFWAPLGMRVDPARRVLWVAATALPQTIGFDAADAGRSGLFRFDLATGVLSGRYVIPPDGEKHALGDVAVARNGDVYATDSRGPAIYCVRAGSDSLERFVTSPLLLSAQGLTFDGDERTLYVADYARGILRLDLATRELRLLETAADVLALGIDGLYFVAGSLVGIQNGVTPHRVVRLRLDAGGDRVEHAEVLERAHPNYAEPTLGVMVGRDLYYVAASQWERFRDDGTIDAPETLRSPLVLRLRL